MNVMSGRDTFNTELLSAYLDGEMPSDERRDVERMLADSDELRRFLGQLRQLSNDLRLLPHYRVGEAVYDRILSEIEQISPGSTGEDEESDSADELISAYLDGELAESDRQRVEQQLGTNAEHRQMLGDLRDLQDSLQSLPTYHLDDGFADRVVRRAERQMLLGSKTDDDQTVAQVATAPEPASTGRRVRWRVYVWAAVAVATAVVLALTLPKGGGGGHTDLVGPGTGTDTPGVVRDPSVAPGEDSPALVDVEPPGETGEHQIGPPGPTDVEQSQWKVVSSIQRNSRQRLVLVYELAITPEGVENAAFANLLKRHDIRFRQTVAVMPNREKALLKHRFLQGVQIVPEDQDDMDEIELYLVSCSARDADHMYHDLLSRPVGVASFFLNLTTADAQDRILHRLCEASGVLDEGGQAVRLMANLAILSRTARNLEVFGSIRWVEPSLMDPSLAPKSAASKDDMPEEFDPNNVGAGPPPEAIATGDFPCELLFVVRNLEPLGSEDEADGDHG